MIEQTELFEDLLGDGDLDPFDDFLLMLGDEEELVLLEAAINCYKFFVNVDSLFFLYTKNKKNLRENYIF